MKPIAPALIGATVLAAAAVFAVPACTANLDVDGRPCPCSDGWTCCETQNVCVRQGGACPGSSIDSGGSDADTVVDGGGLPDAAMTDAGDGGVSGIVVLATNQTFPGKIAVDGENVYWLMNNSELSTSDKEWIFAKAIRKQWKWSKQVPASAAH